MLLLALDDLLFRDDLLEGVQKSRVELMVVNTVEFVLHDASVLICRHQFPQHASARFLTANCTNDVNVP